MGSNSQYFDDDPSVQSQESSLDLILPDLTTTLVTDRGVFSSQKIDAGTKFLLLNAPYPKDSIRYALDLGCGYGAIARVLNHRSPLAEVWATDVNKRALSLARKNLDDFGIKISHPDSIPHDISFDLIWSNPPIRIGKKLLQGLLEKWLKRLTLKGEAILVVQKHLGADSLASWLTGKNYGVERLASKSGYRLLRVMRK
jgi:16S rRNA (guanine1207-N2)-methyltransferase